MLAAVAVSGIAGATEIIIGQASGMASWDPHDDISVNVTNIKRNVFETLVRRNSDLELVPCLATEWQVIDDTTWRFYLRHGVVFHNGEPFDAEDVKFSLERLINPDLALHGTSFVGTIESVEIVDSYTVDIHTRVKDPVLLSRLAFCAFVAPSETFTNQGADKFAKHPVGTGLYEFVEWIRDVQVVLERYEGYWGERPQAERVVFKPIGETSTRIAALEAGEIDIAVSIPADMIERVDNNPELSVEGVRSATNIFVILNANVPPFDNKLVRQAMNYAVDVPTIIEYLFSGHAYQVATVGPAWFGADPDQTPYPYDPVKARDLLEQAGYPNGFETTFLMCPTRPAAATEVSLAVNEYLQEVGVEVTIESYDYGEFIAQWRAAERPMYYFRFGTPILDMDEVFGSYFDPERRALWYTPPEEVLKVARSGLQTTDPDERKQIYSQFLEMIKEEAPWIFLWNFEDLYGVSNRISGFTPRSDELISIVDLGKE